MKLLCCGNCGEPCNSGFHEWVKDLVHCPFIGDDKNYKDLSPNWCDCEHNKVDCCPGSDVHIFVSECDDPRLCYSVLDEQCYCNLILNKINNKKSK